MRPEQRSWRRRRGARHHRRAQTLWCLPCPAKRAARKQQRCQVVLPTRVCEACCAGGAGDQRETTLGREWPRTASCAGCRRRAPPCGRASPLRGRGRGGAVFGGRQGTADAAAPVPQDAGHGLELRGPGRHGPESGLVRLPRMRKARDWQLFGKRRVDLSHVLSHIGYGRPSSPVVVRRPPWSSVVFHGPPWPSVAPPSPPSSSVVLRRPPSSSLVLPCPPSSSLVLRRLASSSVVGRPPSSSVVCPPSSSVALRRPPSPSVVLRRHPSLSIIVRHRP